MTFELYEEYKSKFWNLNMKVSMFVGIFALIVLVFIKYLETEILHYVGLIMFGLFILSQIVELKSFLSKYESIKGNKGKLEINETKIKWNGKEIKWKSIEDINIQLYEIDNKHKWDLSPQNNVSDGLNLINIKTNSGHIFNGYYKIGNEHQMQMLKEMLRNCILINHLKYDVAKKLIQPKSYEEHQLLKRQIKENTNNNI